MKAGIIPFMLTFVIFNSLYAKKYGEGVAKYSTVKRPDSCAIFEKEYSPESDDAIGIFTAIYKASFFGGGTVVLKNKTYMIEQSILLQNNVRLKGAGIGKTILLRSAEFDLSTGGHIIGTEDGGVSDAAITDLTIDGGYTREELNGKEENPLLGIFFNSLKSHNERLLFDGIEVKGCSMGIHLKGCTHVTVQNSDIHDNGGIYLYHNIYYRRVGQALFQNNKIYNSVIGSGLKLAGGTNSVPNESRYFTVINNEIYNNERINLNIQGCNDLLIEGNTLTKQYSTTSKMGALYMVEYGGYQCDNTDVINNLVHDNVKNGMYISGCTAFNVEGNGCYDNGTNYNIRNSTNFSCDYNTEMPSSLQTKRRDEDTDLCVYPQPVCDDLTIRFNKTDFAQLDVLNTRGMIVMRKIVKPDSEKLTISIEDLPTGIYILQLSKNKRIKSVRIVKV